MSAPVTSPVSTIRELAARIDHTNLQPHATASEIRKLCEEATRHHFYGVCVYPHWIVTARKLLEVAPVKVVTVVGFPFGAQLSQTKAAEARHAVEAGADELDVVISLSAARDGHWDFVEHELHEVVSAAQGRVVKVILETACLTAEQTLQATGRAVAAGAQFVKTSTGFARPDAILRSEESGGATVEAVRLLREAVGWQVGVKASGSIRTWEQAQAMLEAGASRLGVSAGVAILEQARSQLRG